MALTTTTKLQEVLTMMTKPTMAFAMITKFMVALIMTRILPDLEDHVTLEGLDKEKIVPMDLITTKPIVLMMTMAIRKVLTMTHWSPRPW